MNSSKFTKFQDKRVLVTGGGGFIGSCLAKELINHNSRVFIFDRSNERLKYLKPIKFIKLDLNNKSSLKENIAKIEPDIIFHLAANPNTARKLENTYNSVESNFLPFINLVDSLNNVNFECFLNVGTSDEYGSNPVPYKEDMPPEPNSPYAASKACTELFCKLFYKTYGMPFVMVRPFLTYGPRQSPRMLVPSMIISVIAKKDFDTTLGEQTRDFNYVNDIVNGMILAASTKKAVGEIINLGSGKEYKIKEVILKINELMGNPIKINFGALNYRKNETMRHFCDNSKASVLLGWKPEYNLEQGLRLTIEWYIKNGTIYNPSST